MWWVGGGWYETITVTVWLWLPLFSLAFYLFWSRQSPTLSILRFNDFFLHSFTFSYQIWCYWYFKSPWVDSWPFVSMNFMIQIILKMLTCWQCCVLALWIIDYVCSVSALNFIDFIYHFYRTEFNWRNNL